MIMFNTKLLRFEKVLKLDTLENWQNVSLQPDIFWGSIFRSTHQHIT